MKKTITLLALAFSIGATTAQTVADFEGFALPVNSFYKDTNSTPWQTPNAVFRYSWDNSFDYWSGGFSYTNKYDTVTAGISNLYGAIPGEGYANSATYVIGQDGGLIKLKPGFNTVDGFYVTNTTFDWKSMKSGDAFAKKFGGPSGNDPDYFGITVKGYHNGVLKSDTVNFYLADFRSTNNAQDYIVKTWEYVNTAALFPVDSIRFYIFSSDVGQFGINTPLFFALDNFSTSNTVVSGLAKNSADLNVNVYPNPFNGALTISLNDNAKAAKANVSDVTGKLVYSENLIQKENALNLEALQPGIYFLELNVNDQKTIKKLIRN